MYTNIMSNMIALINIYIFIHLIQFLIMNINDTNVLTILLTYIILCWLNQGCMAVFFIDFVLLVLVVIPNSVLPSRLIADIFHSTMIAAVEA